MPRARLQELINLARVVASGRTMHHAGDATSFTARFEQALAGKMGTGHALAVNSGTSALVTALVAAGVGPGDEVLIPAYTWVSTAIAPLAVGAIPILVDIDESLTLDVEDLKRKLSPHSRAVIPVHMLNLVCDMDAIGAVAAEHGLVVIEDACQAVGVTYKNRRVGSLGDLGAFSFNHYKNMSSGEGGAVLTNDPDLFDRARTFHDIGSFSAAYAERSFDFVGCNLRVSEFTGAVLHAQLSRLDGYLEKRRRQRRRAIDRLAPFDGGRVSPHHDPDDAVGLTITFDDPRQAERFAAKHRDVVRISDIGRHDYSTWLPVLQHCRADPRTDPFRQARRDVRYAPDMCSATLDILARSCLVSAG